MLEPLTDADWPPELDHLKGGFTNTGNVYRVMAHHPALLSAWIGFRTHVVLQNALGTQISEVVILRTGFRLNSAYEWAHHVARGRKAGLSDARIASVRGPLNRMAPKDALIARAVDGLIDDASLAPPLLAELDAAIGKKGILDLMATVGLYSTLGFIVNSFATPIDADITDELTARPLAETD